MLDKSRDALRDVCRKELASGYRRDGWLEAGSLFPKVRYLIRQQKRLTSSAIVSRLIIHVTRASRKRRIYCIKIYNRWAWSFHSTIFLAFVTGLLEK